LHEIQPFVLPDDDLARFGLATTGSIVPILADLATPDFLFVCPTSIALSFADFGLGDGSKTPTFGQIPESSQRLHAGLPALQTARP
jgi:hypothetical protein